MFVIARRDDLDLFDFSIRWDSVMTNLVYSAFLTELPENYITFLADGEECFGGRQILYNLDLLSVNREAAIKLTRLLHMKE